MNYNERFITLYDALKERGEIKTLVELSNILDTNKAGINDIKTGKKKVTLENINSMIISYPFINLRWFITGQGDMFNSDNENISERRLIPFYDAEAEAGTIMMSNMDAVQEPIEWVDAGDWFRDADSAMRVHGDSMFPEYKSGSIIAMREVIDKHLVVYGEDYVIQTTEYRVIKRLQRSDMKGCWLACSVNEDTWEKGVLAGRLIYEPFDVSIDDVIKLFRVLGCVKRTESSRIVSNKRQK